MTPLFGSSRRAEDFNVLVEATTHSAVPVGAGVAADAEALALLGVVVALRGRGADDEQSLPRAAFSADLRERLLVEARTTLSRVPSTARVRTAPVPPARTRRRRQRWLVAAATASIMVGGTAGMASAAQAALPGQALYPVKRGIEKAVVTLAVSPAGRGRDLLGQAEGRLVEVRGLMHAGAAERTQIPGTLRVFNDQARAGADLMLESYQETDDPAAMLTLRTFAARSLDAVASLSDDTPGQAVPGLRESALLVRDLDTRATAACPTCGDLPAVQVPEVLLTSAQNGDQLPLVDVGVAGQETLDDSHPVPGVGETGLPPGMPVDGLTGTGVLAGVPGSTTTSGATPTDAPTDGSSATSPPPSTDPPPVVDPPVVVDPDPPVVDPPVVPDPPVVDPPPVVPDPPVVDPDPPVVNPPAADPPAAAESNPPAGDTQSTTDAATSTADPGA